MMRRTLLVSFLAVTDEPGIKLAYRALLCLIDLVSLQ